MSDNAPVLIIPLINSFTWRRAEVRRFQAQRFIITVQVGVTKYKLLQIIFGRSDGTIYASFPYFDVTNGIVGLIRLPPFRREVTIDRTVGGRVTSSTVKYAHHPDGEAHFSQDGKVKTDIRKQSVPLSSAEGHLFSLQCQGISHFKPVGPRDQLPPSLKRTILNFSFDGKAPQAIKIVARWETAKKIVRQIMSPLPLTQSNTTIPDHRLIQVGPSVAAQSQDGSIRPAFLIGPPKGWPMERNVLQLTCERTEALDQGPGGILIFYGGFDQRSVATDLAQSTSMLCATYPASDFDQLLQRIGTIDLSKSEPDTNNHV